MPQFEPSSFASQIFWLVVSFGLLYLLMSKIALPRIADILEVRQDRIAADLDRAEALRREAEEARAAYELALSDARSEAQKLLENAAEQAQAEAQTAEAATAKLAGAPVDPATVRRAVDTALAATSSRKE